MAILIPSHKSILSHIVSIIGRIEKNISSVDSIISIDVTLISSSALEMAEITKAIFTGGAYNSQEQMLPFAIVNDIFLPTFMSQK